MSLKIGLLFLSFSLFSFKTALGSQYHEKTGEKDNEHHSVFQNISNTKSIKAIKNIISSIYHSEQSQDKTDSILTEDEIKSTSILLQEAEVENNIIVSTHLNSILENNESIIVSDKLFIFNSAKQQGKTSYQHIISQYHNHKKIKRVFPPKEMVIAKIDSNTINAEQVRITKTTQETTDKKDKNAKPIKSVDYLISAKGEAYILQDETNIISADKLLIDTETETANLNNINLITGKKTSVLNTQKCSIKNNNISVWNVLISGCPVIDGTTKNLIFKLPTKISPFGATKPRFENSDIKISDKTNINNNISINNTNVDIYQEARKKILNSPIAIIAENIQYNTKTDLTTLRNPKLRIFGATIPGPSKITTSGLMDNKIKDGFLPINIEARSRMAGVEIPYYKRISHRQDLTITGSLNTPVSDKSYPVLNEKGQDVFVNDALLIRPSALKVNHRFLLEDTFTKTYFSQVGGLITGNTRLIDPATTLGQVEENGDPIMGNRYTFSTHGAMPLKFISKRAFVEWKYTGNSDGRIAWALQSISIHKFSIITI